MQGVLEELQAVREYEVYQAEYQDDLGKASLKVDVSQCKNKPVEMPG